MTILPSLTLCSSLRAFCLHGDFLKCLQDASESSGWDSVGICAVLKRVRIGLKFVRNSHRSPSACCLLLEKPQLTAPLCIDIQRFRVMFSMLSVPDANVCNPGCIYLQPHLQIFASWKTSVHLYDFFSLQSQNCSSWGCSEKSFRLQI